MRRSRPAPCKPEKWLRTNQAIRAREVRVVTEEGKQLGILPIEEALREAESRGLDLIEVSPNSDPPVCRIMDYGKFRFEQRKKEKESQRKSRQIEIKTIRVRPNTDEHDLEVKSRHARKFLSRGHKVRFNVIFRGPELRHKQIGQRQLEYFIEECKNIAEIDQPPRMEARNNMTMLLSPKPEAIEMAQATRRSMPESSDENYGKVEGKNKKSGG